MADTWWLAAGFILTAALCAAAAYVRSLDRRRGGGSIASPGVLIAGLIAAALLSLFLDGMEAPATAAIALGAIGLIATGLTGLSLHGDAVRGAHPGDGPSWTTIRLVAWSGVPAIVIVIVAVSAMVVLATTPSIEPRRATPAIEALTWLAMTVLVAPGAQAVGRGAARTRGTAAIVAVALLAGVLLTAAAGASPWAMAGSVVILLVVAGAGLAPRAEAEPPPRTPPTMVEALALGLPAILLIGALMMVVAVAMIPAA